FDKFGKRSSHFATLTKAMQAAEEKASDRRRGQTSIFDVYEAEPTHSADGQSQPGSSGLVEMDEWPDAQKLKFEKEALDFYMSTHPPARHDEQLKRFRTHDAAQAVKLSTGAMVLLGGVVTQVQPRTAQKSGKRWAMFQLEDFTGQVKCLLWSDEY